MTIEELRHEIALLLEEEPSSPVGEELDDAHLVIDSLLAPHA